MSKPGDQIRKNPGVWFPPPLLFVVGIAVAILIDRYVEIGFSPYVPRSVQLVLGYGLTLAGLAVVTWGIFTFTRAETGIYPNQPAREIVARGPYRYSRNPMYVGFAAITLGIALLINNVWVVVLLPLVLLALWHFVIRREEAYLTSAFGEGYRAYKARVRRWL